MEKTKQTQTRSKRAETAKLVQAAKAESAQAIKADIHAATKPKRGQPTKFSSELWERVLEAVATYQDLIEICGQDDMPAVSTIYRWMRENPDLKEDMRGAWEMFSMLGKSYNNNILRRGRMSTGDFRRDEALVSDNRWFMGKTNRRDFGDKQTVDLNSTISITVPDFANATPRVEVVQEGEVIDPDAVYERQTVERITNEIIDARVDETVDNEDQA